MQKEILKNQVVQWRAETPLYIYSTKRISCLASRISADRRFALYFKDCIGAIDGTHIAASVPIEEHARYRNRKGFLSQKVLAACDFDLNFVYVLPGWEGSVHDGRVLADAQARHRFDTPVGKVMQGMGIASSSLRHITGYDTI